MPEMQSPPVAMPVNPGAEWATCRRPQSPTAVRNQQQEVRLSLTHSRRFKNRRASSFYMHAACSCFHVASQQATSSDSFARGRSICSRSSSVLTNTTSNMFEQFIHAHEHGLKRLPAQAFCHHGNRLSRMPAMFVAFIGLSRRHASKQLLCVRVCVSLAEAWHNCVPFRFRSFLGVLTFSDRLAFRLLVRQGHIVGYRIAHFSGRDGPPSCISISCKVRARCGGRELLLNDHLKVPHTFRPSGLIK